jgi:hypothetical protein
VVVDAAVQGDVDAEGQESHAASLSHAIARGCRGAPTSISGNDSVARRAKKATRRKVDPSA